MLSKLLSRFRFLIPPLIIIFGAVVMIALSKSRKRPQREKIEFSGALVETIDAELSNKGVVIKGNGSVQPRYEVTLIPQVGGRVDWVHPRLATGNAFSKDDTLLSIEALDYELVVQQAEAAVAQAEYQSEVASANAGIAAREWELMERTRENLLGNSSGSSSENTNTVNSPNPLVLHEPQLRQAEAALLSAKARLEQAKLNLNRTVLTAPFNCRVRSQTVAPGKIVGPSTPLASLYATDIVEIEVGISMGDLAWMQIPGAKAEVILNTGENEYQWSGIVDRSAGVVDQIGRLAKVVVQVKKPFARNNSGKPELSIGSFVTVLIEGRVLEDIVALPRATIRENSTVWVVSDSNTLQIRDVIVKRLTPDEALLSSGINPNDEVIITSLSGAANGMKLRMIHEDEK
ncbi:MAG: HlyD family efflux transporter periplasmic adaptor subunit [Candidatus Electryonea clarkiae]|nr:HlyD family efflux transporter periplasmic adaptor subunit [Candidatus Electryonea clarkiae]MDP8286017.1 HlyD family efflux transporter periplasmic adaptor subunit [Candidatus Electryonea clarkiae]